MGVPADRIVMTSAMLTLGSTVAASTLPEKYGGQGELPSARLLIGTSLTFTGLSMASDFAPSVTGPLAGAIALTAVLHYGLPVLTKWLNLEPTNKKAKKTK